MEIGKSVGHTGLESFVGAGDWETSPLGVPASWPAILRSLLSLVYSSRAPLLAVWGTDLALICNDTFAVSLGKKHARIMGQQFFDVLPELRSKLEPLVDAVYKGSLSACENVDLTVNREVREEQAWFNFTFTPIYDEVGRVAGAIGLVVETTEAVQTARKQGILLNLEQRLRGASAPDRVTAIASEELGLAIGVARVGYGEIDDAQDHVIVAQDWTDGRLESVAGRHRMDNFGPPIIAELKAGRVMSVDDTRTDPRVGSSAFAAIGTEAVLAVPLVKDGQFVAMLFLHHTQARHWSAWEVGLARDVAERTWSAVGQARAEFALEEREARLSAVWEQASAGFARTDLSGRFKEVNERYCAMVGRTRAELLSLCMQDITHPDDLPANLQLLAEVMRSGTAFEIEKRYVRPDESVVWVRNSVTTISSPSGAVEEILAVSVDQTDRRAAEARVQASEARFRGVFESTLMGFTIFDANSGETLAINDTFLEMTGHNRSDFELGRWNWRDFTVPEYLPFDEAAIAEALGYGSWQTYEKEYDRRDGTRFPARISSAPLPGEPGRVVVGVEDITFERAGKRALVASEALARAQADELAGIYNAAPVGLCVLDTNLRYVRINDRMAESNGLPVSRHIGKHVAEVVPDLADQIVKTMRRVLRGQAVLGVELSGETPARPGTIRTWRENWLPLRDGQNTIIGVTVSAEEVTEAKAAEVALLESEDRFRNMADNAPVMMWVTDRDGRCEYLNKAWYDFTGQKLDEALGMGWLDAVHPDDQGRSGQTFLAANVKREAFRLEYRLRRHDNLYRWAIDAASPRFGPRGEFLGYIGSVIDIHERKTAEEVLERRVDQALAERKVLADVVEGTDALVLVASSDFRWLAVNRAAADEFEDAYGVRPRVGDSMLDLLADRPEHRAAVRSVWGRALAGEEFTETAKFGDPGRRQRHFEMKFNTLRDPKGNQIGAYQFAYDITARIREQERLTEAEAARSQADALYRAYFENTPEALFVIGVQPNGDFVVEGINPAHEAGIGLKANEVLGKRISDILPAPIAERIIVTYRHVVETGSIYQYREEYDLKGEPEHWDTSLVPMRDEGGRIVRLIGSSRNVTRQVMAEEALRQSQKMESMGQLTGGVAHDFNNLLTPIIGSLDMLLRRGIGTERERRLIDGALQSAERAKTLVQRLLAFARRQPLQPVPVDLTKLVPEMVGLITSTIGPTIEVRLEIVRGLPLAKADPNQLEMALLNLSVNARDAMPEGGRLTITAKSQNIREHNTSNLKPGEYVVLSVCDTGAGMDAVTQKRAVEPFFSTKGVGKGTGLGLSMVHGLAAQLGGALTIESAPGDGTVVAIYLPVSDGIEDSIQRSYSEPLTRPGRGIVLLVDDEELVRLSTSNMLTDLGFDVVEAVSGEDALHLLKMGIKPNLLVTDHLMPGMSGVDLVREARHITPTLPALIVSGYAEMDGLAPDLPRLTKPFRNAELVEIVGSLIPPPSK